MCFVYYVMGVGGSIGIGGWVDVGYDGVVWVMFY